MSDKINIAELQEVSMKIILCAGDARNLIVHGFQALANKQFQQVADLLTQSQKLITQAHRTHTDILQQEANDISIPYSVLFNHAQDTLMTVQSEQLILRQVLHLTKTLLKEDLKNDEQVN